MTLARNLAESGVQVIAIDKDGKRVNEIKDDVDIAVRLNSTDQSALLSQDLDKVDACVVAIGEQFESALLTTVIAKQIGVPEIVCRAQSDFHAEIFRKIGADKVIQPERQAGENLARQLSNPQLVDFIQLADGFTLLELRTPKSFQGKTIRELALRNEHNINLIVIRREQPKTEENEEPPVIETMFPHPDDQLRENDVLIVVGSDDALARLPRE